MAEIRRGLPGVAVCLSIAAASFALTPTSIGARLGTSVLAMVFGIALAHVLPARPIEQGARWVVKAILPLGIVLLGARVHGSDLVALGTRGVAMGAGVILLSAVFFLSVRRWGGFSPQLAVLLAMGNGICGGSAIAAAAPVIGARRDEIAASVSAVVIAGTLGTLLLPILGGAMELDAEVFGLWAGLSLQQTPQVVAAGLSHGPEAGAVATAAKLVRISLLVPVIFLLGIVGTARANVDVAPAARLRKLVPGFLWGFLLVSAASTLSLLPEIAVEFSPASWFGGWRGSLPVREVAINGSEFCMVLALAAIGLETRWETLKEVGGRAMLAALLGAALITSAVGVIVVGGFI